MCEVALFRTKCHLVLLTCCFRYAGSQSLTYMLNHWPKEIDRSPVKEHHPCWRPEHVGEMYDDCCQREELYHPIDKNRFAGYVAKIRPEGNPSCWRHAGHSYTRCCNFQYMGIWANVSGELEPVRYLPWKSAGTFLVTIGVLPPFYLRQNEYICPTTTDPGQCELFFGYGGVLWESSIALSWFLIFVARFQGESALWTGRAIELGAGAFALPARTLTALGRFSQVIATDAPGIINVSADLKPRGLESNVLDFTSTKHLREAGTFDVILDSVAVLQHNDGPEALISLSHQGSLVYVATSQDSANNARRDFLERNYFSVREERDPAQMGLVQPKRSGHRLLVWERIAGPITCWSGEFTFERCCQQKDDQCFDKLYSRKRCCGECPNSNGVTGYRFSHNGWWDYFVAKGTAGTDKECATVCNVYPGCIGFNRNFASDNCFVYTIGGAKSFGRFDRAYEKCI